MSKKVLIPISVIIALAVISLVVWLVVDINLPPRFEVDGGKLIIRDTYKAEIDLINAKIVISNDKLELTQRVVGTATGNIRKGNYTIKDIEGEVYLSMMQFGEDYIFIKNGETRYYINMQTHAQTIDLYNKLLSSQN